MARATRLAVGRDEPELGTDKTWSHCLPHAEIWRQLAALDAPHEEFPRLDLAAVAAAPKATQAKRSASWARTCVTAPTTGLRAEQARKKTRRRRASAGGGLPSGPHMVFTGKYGTPIDPRTLNRRFTARCDRAGVRHMTVHDARRTRATLLVDVEVHPRVIMRIRRYADVSMTSIRTRARWRPAKRSAGRGEPLQVLLLVLSFGDDLRELWSG